MTVTKTMTDAALAANKANSQKSTRPRSKAGKEGSKLNAVRHQLLANHFVLGSDQERADFESLVDGIAEGLQPVGILEEMQAAEIAVTWKKHQMALALESAEVLRRRGTPENILSAVFQSQEVQLPIDPDGFEAAGTGWEVQTITVKAQGDADSANANSRREVASNSENPGRPANCLRAAREAAGRRLEVEAVLGSALERITRYDAQVLRDHYRAIATLRRLRADRLGLEVEE